jgi:Zn-dependent peptidase ImmA (M78 family)/transcriptional regulator with XRE-family HTH domain
MNQSELAEQLGMTNGNMSKIERGDTALTDENLQKISTVTGFPESFFYQEGDIIAENLSFRKRETVAQKLITPITAKANIIRLHVQFLAEQLGLTTEHLPAIEVTDTNTSAQIAGEVRKRWGLKFPDISSVTELLEDHGIVISSFPFITERVDSRCMLTDYKQPVIFLNSQMLGDRQRFSLAFELGHLVMHTFFPVPLDRNINREANQFAAEFLMPEEEIRPDFERDVSVALLGELKRKWKVSMISLLYRADDLGYVSPNQKRYILQQFNQLQIRRREPVELDVPIEKPKLLRRWIADFKDKNKFSTAQVAEALHLTTDEFIEVYS